MISVLFPPMAAVGAKRPLHLVRNLPRFGWDPVVLSGDPALEAVDPALSEVLPPGLPVSRGYTSRWIKRPARRKTRRDVPGPQGRGRGISYLDPFDRYLPALRAGIRESLRLIREFDPRVIHVCADPWTSLLAGIELRRRTGLPLIADLRDPWSLHQGKMALRSPATRWLIRRLERRVFRTAQRVVLNTEECRDAYAQLYEGRIPGSRFVAIRNAFDGGLFLDRPIDRTSAFQVLHFGDFRRFVPAEPLLRGFASFIRRNRLAPGSARLRCVGQVPAEARSLALELGLDPFLEILPPVPYRESLSLLKGADVLALCNGAGIPVIPSKLYDYLAARRPILSLSGNAEPNRIVLEAGAGLAAPPDDPEAIAAALSALRTRAAGPARGEVAAEAVEPFSAVEQSRRFSRVLDEISEG
jgi:glycosyltransferase involved in cell wall biosynthesis